MSILIPLLLHYTVGQCHSPDLKLQNVSESPGRIAEYETAGVIPDAWPLQVWGAAEGDLQQASGQGATLRATALQASLRVK